MNSSGNHPGGGGGLGGGGFSSYLEAADSFCLITCHFFLKSHQGRGFPGGAVVKNPPANAGDTRSSPGPGRSHMPRSN